jgi:hypothetical protein
MIWTLYPVTSILERVYHSLVTLSDDPTTHTPPECGRYHVEFASCLERVIAKGISGDNRPLIRGLMDELWLSRGLVDQGFPMLNPEIVRLTPSTRGSKREFSVSILRRSWPLSDVTGYPLMGSAKALAITYGERYQKVSS